MTDRSAAAAAAELLELEGLSQLGALTPTQDQRWQALAIQVFGPDVDVYVRRSFRLEANAKALVRIKQSEFSCTLTQLSHMGCAFKGDVLRFISKEELIDVRWVQAPGGQVDLGLKCKVVWTGAERSIPDAAGAIFLPENEIAVRRRYFDEVYYPFYLSFLRKLSEAK